MARPLVPDSRSIVWNGTAQDVLGNQRGTPMTQQFHEGQEVEVLQRDTWSNATIIRSHRMVNQPYKNTHYLVQFHDTTRAVVSAERTRLLRRCGYDPAIS